MFTFFIKTIRTLNILSLKKKIEVKNRFGFHKNRITQSML